jgi:hypothetical protein
LTAGYFSCCEAFFSFFGLCAETEDIEVDAAITHTQIRETNIAERFIIAKILIFDGKYKQQTLLGFFGGRN